MDSQEGTRWRFPTDAFVEILLRLPPNTRRRFRLVSRHWRDVVDESWLMLPHCPKTLVAPEEGSPFVIDDRTGRRRDLWSSSTPSRCRSMCIVGTSNGLVCLCDNEVRGGPITVANLVTGETLDAPPLLPLPPPIYDCGRLCDHGRWHLAYGFGYLPATKRYKVVRPPCRFDDQDWEYSTLQVYTLGEESWREVAIPTTISGCKPGLGFVSINGTMYWASADWSVVSFDLEEERVMRFKPQPLIPESDDPTHRWFLTEVHGRLGIVFKRYSLFMENAEVWVMDNTEWNLRYSLLVSSPRNRPGQRPRGYQCFTRPHFVQYSDHVLTWESNSSDVGLYKHKPQKNNTSSGSGSGDLWGGVVEINNTCRETLVADVKDFLDFWVFAYVETRESLSVYAIDSGTSK